MIPRLSLNPEAEHAFYELGPRRFEQFARSLHEAQPNIASSKLYGPDGQEQFGIDHVAFRRPEDGGGIEVGQAKAERRFGPVDIRRAADKFLAHWDGEWRERQVRRFILIVGCAIKSRKAADEIIAQHARFAALGVEFLVWDSTDIFDRLHGANVVVRAYLGQDWYEHLFGKPSGPLDGLQHELEKGWSLGALRVQSLVTRLNQAETAEIAELKRRARRGEVARVVAELENALDSEVSKALAPSVKAEKLRLLAGLILNDGDQARVRQLLDQADRLDGDSARLRAILLLESLGVDAVLESIDAGERAELAEVRAVALLRQDRRADAFVELQPFLDAENVRAETVRLTSLAKLQMNHRNEAVELAERAISIDSESRACQQVLGICLFHRALSPAAEVTVGEWPQPVDQPLVGLSDASRADLERAESIFKALMAGSELEGHHSMLMWHFGVLACMPWRHDDTVARLAELQDADELPIPLIVWALSRALPFDRERATAQIDAEIHGGSGLETIIIRIALANADRDRKTARRILDRHRAAFAEAGRGDLFDYWSTVVELESRQQVSDEALRAHPWLKLRRAMDLRPKKRRRAAVADLLESELEREGDPRVILASTQMLLDAGWHKSAAKAAPALIERIGTAEAIATAAHALFCNEQYAQVLTVLENVDVFPGGALPLGLERIRTNALAQTGEIILARDASLAIARSTRNPNDLWRSIHLQLAIGAAPDALTIYEENADILSVPVPGHIVLARAVLKSHPEAASRITRHISANPPDELVTAAFDLASKLKLEAERRTLTGRIYQLGAAGKAGVMSISVDDLPKIIQERRERFEQAFEKYANGHIPVHLMASFRPGALVYTYLAPLLQPPDPQTQQIIHSIRYGRRPDSDRWPADRADARIFADITALLSAHGLGLLDAVESAFRPLWIAPEAVQALLALVSDIEIVQPDRIDAIRRVLGRLDDREIGEWTQVAAASYRVEWELEGARQNRALSFHRLADLALKGRSRSETSRIREQLGNTLDSPATGARPRDGASLLLGAGIAVTLEEVGLLHGLSRRFAIGLDIGDVTEMRAAILDADRRDLLGRHLASLIRRLRDGLEDGTYKTVPAHETEQTEHAARAFIQLLHALLLESGIGWFDDRYTNSATGDGFETATTVEIIGALVRYGRLSKDAGWQYRQKLRAARWLFIAPEGDEIAHFMRSATAQGLVTENVDLATLRRATGEALLHRRRLQWPDAGAMAQGFRGEVPFLLDSGHAVSGALVAIWNNPKWSIADAEAASGWMVDTLDIGLFPTQLIAAGDPRSDHLLGVHLGGLVLNAIQIFESNGRKGRQQAYLDWMWRHVLARTLRLRPEIRPSLEGFIEDHLTKTEDGVMEGNLWLSLGARLLNSLPLPLRVPLLQRAAIREAFNLSGDGQVTVENFEFPADDFWAALVETTIGQQQAVETVEGQPATVALLNEEDGEQLQLVVGKRKLRLDQWPRRVSSDNVEDRREALLERRFVMDMSLGEIRAFADQLGAIEPRHARVRAALTRSHQTMQQWYTDFDTALMERRPFAIADLRPDSVSKILRHLRLQTDLDAAAVRLIEERGIPVAVRRIGGLPIATPNALRDALATLGSEALRLFLDEVEAETSPPWTQCFLADALLELEIDDALRARIQSWLDEALSDRAAPLWQLWIALARFTGSESFGDDAWTALEARPQVAICWSHASALVEILVAGHVSLEHLLAQLHDNRLASPRLLVDDLDQFSADAANPHAMTVERLKVHVAAPALLQLRRLEGFEEWAERTLRSLILFEDDGKRHPRIRITEGSLAAQDSLPSRFNAPLGKAMEAIYPGAQGLFRDGVEDLLIALLEADPKSTDSAAAWTLLRHASGASPLPAKLADVVGLRRASLHLGFAGHDLSNARWHLLNYVTLASLNGWNEQEELDRVAAAVETLSARGDEDDAGVLFEIAFWRSRLVVDKLERTKFLAKELLKLASHEPFREQAIVAARQFARNLSGQETEAFVDALGELMASY